MRRFIPDSIAARTILVLLIGLTLSHVASMAVYYGDRATALTLLDRGHIAEHIVTITRLIDDAPVASRAQIIEAANRPTLQLTWSRRLPEAAGRSKDWRIVLMRDVLRDHMGGVGGHHHRTVVQYTDAKLPEASPGANLRVSVQLRDSTWLNFVVPASEPESFLSIRFVLSLTLMAAAVIAGAVWAARRLTAPLATFARAAQRLGVDVNAPFIPDSGPHEVRQAASAFNEMQRRIRRHISDRTQMLAAISHDLRTPITRLRLRAEFVEDAAQQTKMLHDLDEMEAMISSVLSFAQEDAAGEARERIDLAALIQSICDDMADADLPVRFEEHARLPFVGGRLALKRAFTNLIDNAVKYGKRARVRLALRGDRILVQIDDDGPGIPKGEREKVFAPFYRIERSRSRDTGGAGLGLAFTRTIIRAHSGDITLSNRPKGGLRVEVTLPR